MPYELIIVLVVVLIRTRFITFLISFTSLGNLGKGRVDKEPESIPRLPIYSGQLNSKIIGAAISIRASQLLCI